MTQTKILPWPFNGYAPGGYLCTCRSCSVSFQGDKRAMTCLSCAVVEAKKEQSAALSTLPIAGEGKDIDRCARLIEENIIKDTSGGKILAPRQDGNRDGLFYATAIRALDSSSPGKDGGQEVEAVWVEHDGKDMPVHHAKMVLVKQRGGYLSTKPIRAGDLHHSDYKSPSCWVHTGSDCDIVAYSVVAKADGRSAYPSLQRTVGGQEVEAVGEQCDHKGPLYVLSWGACCGKCGEPYPFEASPKPASTALVDRLEAYDAGLLNDFGGGDVSWWQDYIRAELDRAHEFYAAKFSVGERK